MISEELLKKIQGFHFKTRFMASDLFAGQYESAFKGRGMEFAEVREYQPGDDIRSIDWNVSARCGRPFVKVFHEERELTVMLLMDLSGSHLFGTRGKFKRELLAEIAGMLAFLAIRTNDKVGAILFSSKVEKYIPPKKGASHVWRLIKEIFSYQPEEMTTRIETVLDYLNRVVKRHAVVFMISDCWDMGFEKSLKLASKKHDLTIIRISDPAEEKLPDVGLVNVRDPETGKMILINTGSRKLRQKWYAHQKEHKDRQDELFKRIGADYADISTNGSVVESLTRLFNQRSKKMG
jgi:uncharacterized protein (DUF58 family)